MVRLAGRSRSMVNTARVALGLAAILLGSPAVSAVPQDGRAAVGIALSGGGAKGLAHIGVLKVLEEAGIRVDFVSGTSMGSIIGGLYAMGYTAAQVESVALSLNWREMFTDDPPRTLLSLDQKLTAERTFTSFAVKDGSLTLPSGVVTGQKIAVQLSEVTLPAHGVRDFATLPRPYVCIATDLVSGKAAVLRRGDLGDAIRASMSIPTVFAPKLIDSTLLVDGGLVRNLPVEDVRALGASFVIAVDVSDPPVSREELRTLPEILNQTMNLAMAPSVEQQRRLADFLIAPDIAGVTTLDFEDVPSIIARGEKSARAIMPALRRIADSLGFRIGGPVVALPSRDSIEVEGIDVEGDTPLGPGTVLRILPFRIPGTISAAQLRDGVERIHSTGLYKTVDYRVVRRGGQTRVVLRVEGQEATSLRLGVRYDSDANASFLAGLRIWNVGREMASLNVELQVGERYEADIQYALPFGVFSTAGVLAQVTGKIDPIDLYADGERVANGNLWTAAGKLSAGTFFSRSVLIAGGARAEYARLKQDVSLVPFDVDYWTYVLEGIVGTDSRDRVVYPRRGFSGFAVAELGTREFDTGGDFLRWFGIVNAALSLGDRFAIVGSALLGSTEINAPPPHENFMLGGVRRPAAMQYRVLSRATFAGYSPYEVTGRQAQLVGVSCDYYLTQSLVVSLGGNAGGAFPEGGVTFSGHSYKFGAGATIGYLSVIGPVQFSLVTSKDHPVSGYLSIGYDF